MNLVVDSVIVTSHNHMKFSLYLVVFVQSGSKIYGDVIKFFCQAVVYFMPLLAIWPKPI